MLSNKVSFHNVYRIAVGQDNLGRITDELLVHETEKGYSLMHHKLEVLRGSEYFPANSTWLSITGSAVNAPKVYSKSKLPQIKTASQKYCTVQSSIALAGENSTTWTFTF